MPAITFYKENIKPVLICPEADNFPVLSLLRAMGYTDFELAVMDYFKGFVPLIIQAAKNKGMRFEVSDIEDGEIIRLNEDVMIFRGCAGKLLYNLFKGA